MRIVHRHHILLRRLLFLWYIFYMLIQTACVICGWFLLLSHMDHSASSLLWTWCVFHRGVCRCTMGSVILHFLSPEVGVFASYGFLSCTFPRICILSRTVPCTLQFHVFWFCILNSILFQVGLDPCSELSLASLSLCMPVVGSSSFHIWIILPRVCSGLGVLSIGVCVVAPWAV